MSQFGQRESFFSVWPTDPARKRRLAEKNSGEDSALFL